MTTLDGAETRCQCKVCILSRKVEAVQEKLSPEDRAVIEELRNENAHNSMEAGRNSAFIKGHWPGTKPIAHSSCKHEWTGSGEPPSKWNCTCGALVYRSYEDYCWD